MSSIIPPGRFGALLLGLTALPLAHGGPARAQTADTPQPAAEDTIALPDVDVTGRREQALDPIRGFVASQQISGTKTDTPLIENPQSITVVPRDQIDARLSQTLGEALRYTSGIRGENYGTDSRTDWLQIRGFNAQDNGIFLNGLRYNTGYAGSMLETYGLERFEVLRGPTSVLYGQIAPGGLVNMVQRRPSMERSGELRLTAGLYDRIQGQGYSTGRLNEDGTLTYNITGLVRGSDTRVPHVRDDRTYIAPAITWRPTDRTSITLSGYFQRDQTAGNQFLPYLGTVTPTAYGRINRDLFTGEPDFNRFNRTQYGVGYEVSHRFDDVFSVEQSFRYGRTSIDWAQVYGGGLLADQRTLQRYNYAANIDVSTLQWDTRGRADFTTGAVQHTALLGFDYSRVSYRNAQQFSFGSGLDVFSPRYGRPVGNLPAPYDSVHQTNNQFGLYAQDQMRIGRLVLLAGIRQDWATSHIDDRDAGTQRSLNNSAFTWRAGAVYLTDSGLAPYVSYSRSFQPQLGTDGAGNGWRPLEGEQYEVGVKYQPPGMRSFIQASLFQLTQQNTLTADPNFVFQQVATGQIRVRGAELEGIADLDNGFRLIGQLSLLDPEITRSNTVGEVGHRSAGVARFNAGLYGEYAFRRFQGPLSGLTLGAGVRYLGNTSAVNTGGELVPSATLFDATMRYDLAALKESLGGWQVSLAASNLADTRYVSRCSGVSGCFYGNGLNVLGSIAYRW
jgi:iron complex outermembrane receptor protein